MFQAWEVQKELLHCQLWQLHLGMENERDMKGMLVCGQRFFFLLIQKLSCNFSFYQMREILIWVLSRKDIHFIIRWIFENTAKYSGKGSVGVIALWKKELHSCHQIKNSWCDDGNFEEPTKKKGTLTVSQWYLSPKWWYLEPKLINSVFSLFIFKIGLHAGA